LNQQSGKCSQLQEDLQTKKDNSLNTAWSLYDSLWLYDYDFMVLCSLWDRAARI